VSVAPLGTLSDELLGETRCVDGLGAAGEMGGATGESEVRGVEVRVLKGGFGEVGAADAAQVRIEGDGDHGVVSAIRGGGTC